MSERTAGELGEGDAPSCSVVVCTREREHLLARCLASLAAQTVSPEIIVVDNTAGSVAVEAICKDYGAELLVEPRLGINRARNAGAMAARGRWIAFIDDDAIAEPDWLERHIAQLNGGGLMVTTGRVLPISLDTEAERSFAAMGGLDLGAVPFRVDRENPDWFEIANFGGIGAAASNMVFSRELFDRGWRFDPSLGIGAGIHGEEHHACYSILRDGHTIAYVPGAIVKHPYPETAAELRERQSRTLINSSAYLTMLFLREPRYRGRTLSYGLNALRGGQPQPWRTGKRTARFGTRSMRVRAAIGGPVLYARTRVRHLEPVRRLRAWARTIPALQNAFYLYVHLRGYLRETPEEVRRHMQFKYAADADPWKYASATTELERYSAALDLVDRWRGDRRPRHSRSAVARDCSRAGSRSDALRSSASTSSRPRSNGRGTSARICRRSGSNAGMPSRSPPRGISTSSSAWTSWIRAGGR